MRPVAIARLGRTQARLAVVRAAGAGEIGLDRFAEVAQPGLTGQNHPAPKAGDLLAALAADTGAADITLVLPPGTASLKRAEVNLPVRGPIVTDTIAEALTQAETAFAAPDTAILSARPLVYAEGSDVIAAPGEDPPLGETVGDLRVTVVAACAPVALLAAFDGAVRSAGLTLEGVIPASEALAAISHPRGDGAAIHLFREETIVAEARGGIVAAQLRVPIGRRHLESDLAQAFALEPPEAARRADAVLAGTSSDDDAIDVVGKRLEELGDLITASAGRAELMLGTPVISGLPRAASRQLLGGTPSDTTALPVKLRADPILAGGAYLALGLRGGLERASLPEPKKPSPLDWLLKRF